MPMAFAARYDRHARGDSAIIERAIVVGKHDAARRVGGRAPDGFQIIQSQKRTRGPFADSLRNAKRRGTPFQRRELVSSSVLTQRLRTTARRSKHITTAARNCR